MLKGKRLGENFEPKGGERPLVIRYVPKRVPEFLKRDTFRLSYLKSTWNLNEFE